MPSLKKQIKNTEKSLSANHVYIQAEAKQLSTKLTLTHLLLISSTGLLAGYLLSRRRTLKTAIYQFLITSIKLARFSNSLQRFFHP